MRGYALGADAGRAQPLHRRRGRAGRGGRRAAAAARRACRTPRRTSTTSSARADAWRTQLRPADDRRDRHHERAGRRHHRRPGQVLLRRGAQRPWTRCSSTSTSRASRPPATLDAAATSLNVVLIGIAVVFVLIVGALAIGLRLTAIRPVWRLAQEVRTVASGDFDHQVEQSGPREVRELGADVNLMRRADPAGAVGGAARAHRAGRADAGPGAVERRAGAVRLHRLPRPAGAAAQGGELLPAARAAVQGPARRAGRPVHRVRGRRREADAGADQRPARVQPGRPGRARVGRRVVRRGARAGAANLVDRDRAVRRDDRGGRRCPPCRPRCRC